MRDAVHKGIRIEKVLQDKIQERATSAGISWSQWVRQILRREVGLIKDRKR